MSFFKKLVNKLNERQKRFADEYLIDLNAERAAIRAGYSKKYARGNAHKLVANSCISEYIKKRMAEKESELIADQDEVLKYLTAVMRGEEKDETLTVNPMGELEKISVRKQANQLKAAEMLAKRHGLLVEKVESDIDMSLNITIDYGDEDDSDSKAESEEV